MLGKYGAVSFLFSWCDKVFFYEDEHADNPIAAFLAKHVGKKFSRQHFYFLIVFSQKIDFDFSCKLFPWKQFA